MVFKNDQILFKILTFFEFFEFQFKSLNLSIVYSLSLNSVLLYFFHFHIKYEFNLRVDQNNKVLNLIFILKF